ncbi:MAG: alpha-amylase [Chloroflexi bacterium]|nr:alpha-amylase [Chloroflexota bacterium]
MMKKWFLIGLLLALSITPVLAQETAPSAPWWNDRVFYEIFVRSFYDSDADGIGDLQGVIQKLDYLNDGDPNTTTDLGVTGIWLMPITQSPSYHGYDVTDYQTVDEDYGTTEDFRELMAAAHERGIAVIVDFVANHTSDQISWFTASARGDEDYADWYIWSDTDPGYAGPWGQGVWHQRNGRYFYGVFWSGMPDLNYTNPEVTETMYDNARFWLEDMGADGFRMDALRYVVEEDRSMADTDSTLEWTANFNAYMDSINPNSLMVGEVWTDSDTVAQYLDAGSLDLAFEFDLATAMMSASSSGSSSIMQSRAANVNELYPNGQYAAFLTNHDQNRVMSELRSDVNKAKVAASLLLTNRGVPFIYYGEEIGMIGEKPDERIRTPMQWELEATTVGFTDARRPWEPMQSNFTTANVATQTDDADSLLSHYRNLIHLRNDHIALRQGDYIAVESGSRKLYAFIRQHADETLLVLINVDDEPITDYALTLAEGSFTLGTPAVIFGQGELTPLTLNMAGGFDAYQPFAEVAPYSTTVIRLASAGE